MLKGNLCFSRGAPQPTPAHKSRSNEGSALSIKTLYSLNKIYLGIIIQPASQAILNLPLAFSHSRRLAAVSKDESCSRDIRIHPEESALS